MASFSRARSSSPFSHRKPPSPCSSVISTSSYSSSRIIPRSCSSSASSYFNTGGGFSLRSSAPSRPRSESGSRGYANRSSVVFGSDEMIAEPVESQRNGDSISVTIRFRPLSEREFQRGDEIVWHPDGDKTVRNEYHATTSYAFDRVFGPLTSSQDVYDVAAKPVVKAAMEGVNGTIFAYGVTSSGKTHTMHGDQSFPGIIPLAIKDVFSIIQDTPGREFLLRVSYLEIYNEVINDLLDPTGQNLRVREDAQGTYVEGIKEEVVLSPGHVLSFIAAGEEHRHVGSNNFNLLSSRSHTIFTLMIESSAHGDDYDGVIFSQLNLIDLAGSESSKTETTGLRRKEGSYINKSLLTLGTVIGKLSEGKASHVPYRDSKLTRLLQSSLSGHGHVSLICTVTPASSSMEETHNTLKFASRAKRVEIYASRNKIIDEKSLIKKYQKEISILKQELDQLKKRMLAGVSQEEILSLRQQLEEGQVKMQSRLEEEEEAKAALMSRIQRLTKLILVSTKNTIPGSLNAPPPPPPPSLHRSHSDENDEKVEALQNGGVHNEHENHKDFTQISAVLPDKFELKQRFSGMSNGEPSPVGSVAAESTQLGDLISHKVSVGAITQDEMDLIVEQVKMLAGEIALSTSTLKRLVEQSINDPDNFKFQIHDLEQEIQEKRRQMRVLEQRIIESGEAYFANASLLDMQQTVMRLMTQCNEKAFELELKKADNRILQEQLQNKCLENNELKEKVRYLEEQAATGVLHNSADELRARIPTHSSEKLSENEKLTTEALRLSEENGGLRIQNQKLVEEAAYAKELASAAAVELKNLADEVTKLSLENAKLETDLSSARELSHSRSASSHPINGINRKHGDGARMGRRGRISGRVADGAGFRSGDGEPWNVDLIDELKLELQARKQREAALEAALAEREDDYRNKYADAKKREETLENDLANMWVIVAKLKKDGAAHNSALSDCPDPSCPSKPAEITREISLVDRLKARIQEMKEKEPKISNF